MTGRINEDFKSSIAVRTNSVYCGSFEEQLWRIKASAEADTSNVDQFIELEISDDLLGAISLRR